jgi:hypothetical protein
MSEERDELWEFEGDWYLAARGEAFPICLNTEMAGRFMLSLLDDADLAIRTIEEKITCKAGDCENCDFLRGIVKILED